MTSQAVRAAPALALLLLGPLSPLGAQGPPVPDDAFGPLRERIEKVRARENIPSVAVAVAKDGEILWEQGFGWADLERSVAVGPHTLYSLASISKPMTATALLTLVEAGRVDLDAPANAYLSPEGGISGFAGPDSLATVRRVLAHTAGLPLHWQFFYRDEDHGPAATDEAIRRYAHMVFPPGRLFNYSNLGYGILERIIERASGRDYEDFMQEVVFQPLGMTRTTISKGDDLEGQAAVRYDAQRRPIPPYDFDHRGGSAVWASAHDLVRFGMYHLGERLEGQEPVLSPETLLAMKRPLAPDSSEWGYGMGWSRSEDAGFVRWSHTGGMPGVSTALHLYPEARLVVVVLMNARGPASNVASGIAHRLLLPDSAQADRVSAAGDQRAESQEEEDRPLPGALAGTWGGSIHTYQGEVGFELVVAADGSATGRIGEGRTVPLEDADYEDGALTGSLATPLPTEDALRHPHVVRLRLLRIGEDRLAGQATAVAADAPPYFSISSYATLRRR